MQFGPGSRATCVAVGRIYADACGTAY